MAAAEKILDLIRSYSENNEERFYTIAMQIAASEAKKGHSKVAQELKEITTTDNDSLYCRKYH